MLTRQEQLAYFPMEEWEDSLRQEEMMESMSNNCTNGVCSITPEQLRLLQQMDDEDDYLAAHPF